VGESTPAALDLDEYPNLHELSSRLAENAAAQEFEESLDNLLTRLDAIRIYGPE
jgi:hypothetical protein